ncbi:hypothetical protein CLHUN_17040 [Ruminiclostridium hungatei]|uniref:Uncharacterized protein n=1 Tax=Ruminiclostridium hungatei TaxID=48256 RepID=A0A1V4SLP6_RUMHU|nr:hypothetical protein [Ruminiclostridium hungatei]OPX44405.1 hypothetical protein CLHUN_17040 [Ruminiclostridium hungatei]
MSILDELIKIFTPNHYDIYDSIAQTTVQILTNYNGLEISQIYKCLYKFPSKDRIDVRIRFTVDEVITISNEAATEEPDIRKSIEDLHETFLYEVIEISITIQKTNKNYCSIYCINKFNEWLLSKSHKEVMQIFSGMFKSGEENIRFICYDFDGLLATNTISFSKPDSETAYYNDVNRHDIISNSRRICNFYNHSQYDIIPDDFNVVVSSNVNSNILRLFRDIKIFLSLIYISDIADFDGDNINITIKGYKTIDYKIPLSTYTFKENQNVLYETYKWLYNGGNVHDKSQLARNIMTLHCKYSSILELDEKTFASINANYGLYLKENVNNYLNVKKDITAFVQSNIQEVTKAISSFSSDFKKNFFAFFSYFVTLMVSSSFAKLRLKDIFTPEITTITSCILAGSIIYWLISLYEIISKYRMMNKSTDSLKDSYNDILDTIEVQTIIEKDKSLKPNKDRFRNNLILISFFWLGMVVALFLALDSISGSNPLLFKFNIFN